MTTLDQLPAPPPYPVARAQSRYARHTWWRGFELAPGVCLKTSARLRPALAVAQDQPRVILAAVAQAASAALSLHPRLNYFTFWGRLVWAGLPPRVALVLENPDQSCDLVNLSAAHDLCPGQILRLLAQRPLPALPSPWARLREAWPLPCYLAERLSGALARNYARDMAPLFISQLGLPGIEELSFTPAHSMALYPAWPQDGRLSLTLCFNHQLANARPVGRFLLCIKELLEG